MSKISLISGVSYLMIFIFGMYANFVVFESMIDLEDHIFTITNILNNRLKLGIGILSFGVMLFFDIVLIPYLFILTKSVSKRISLFASIFRGIHSILFLIALLKLWGLYQLQVDKMDSLILKDVIYVNITDFNKYWTIGLMFFGIHLILLGYLSIKSFFLSKPIGVLLILSGIAYIFDGTAKFIISDYFNYKYIFETIVVVFAVIGEFSFTIWLLVYAFKKSSFEFIHNKY